ncbi:ferredoxin family protein [Candidatus Poribacteria bacterium]|nr:ferredoxin family protein [Candidatus Poribacteria bacterium]
MAYVICEPCVDVMDTACVDVCPVDCIHTTDGEKQLYISPDECIDCGACDPVCPVTAIFMLDVVPDEWQSYNELNSKFFETFVKPESSGDDGEGADGKGFGKFRASDVEEFVQLPSPPTSSIRAPLRPLVMLSQPLLGAFSAKFKNELEEMAGSSKIFSAAISTGISSLINLALYPIVFFLIAVNVEAWGISFFTSGGNLAILLGVALAIAEGMFRFKDDLVTTSDDGKSKYGAALYGWIPSFIAYPLLSALRSALVTEPGIPRSTVPGAVLTDGPIYTDDVRERYRRYGMINQVKEMPDYYAIEIEMPRWVPDCGHKKLYDLPDRMPDYTYQISLEDNAVMVETKLEDPRFAEVLGRTSSFPNGFRNTFYVEGQPEDYKVTYRDNLLQIIIPKSGKVEELNIEHQVHYAKLKG